MIRARIIRAMLAVMVLAACTDPMTLATEPTAEAASTGLRPGEVTKGYRYEGCGDDYGTCARVVLTAEPLGAGLWRFRGEVENRSFQARGELRSALLLFMAVDGGFANLWDGYREFDCGGCNDPGPNVIFASFTGAYDQRCEQVRRCGELKWENYTDFGPASRPWAVPQRVEFHYMAGVVRFDQVAFAPGWTPETPVQVTQFFVGGQAQTDPDGGIETYDLHLRSTAPVRLPSTLAAAAAPRRTPEQALQHVARASATLRRAQLQADRLQR